jgi:hypothetical protein
MKTSWICESLPDDVWDLILAKTDPYACLLFGRDEIIAEVDLKQGLRWWVLQAIRVGHLGVVKILDRRKKPSFDDWYRALFCVGPLPDDWTPYAMDVAALNGHLEVVQWLHENRKEGCTKIAMDGAAMCGHLEVVKYLHENGKVGCNEVTMVKVAECGRFEVLKWLYENLNEECRGNTWRQFLRTSRGREVAARL